MKKILALFLALVLVLPLASCRKKKKGDDPAVPVEDTLTPLYDLDLTEYLEIDASYYKNYTANIVLNNVTDEELDAAIADILEKKLVLVDDADVVIEEGHTVHIFYTGYYLDQEGVRVDFDTNVNHDPYALEIGSGTFIDGFEDSMIGKKPADYNTENPMLIEATFPEDYHEPSLAGVDAYFEVTVATVDGKYLVFTDATELNDVFLRYTLGVTEEALAGYAGSTLTEKYRAYLLKAMQWDGVVVEDYSWRAFCDSVLSGVVVKKYPEKHLEKVHTAIMTRFENAFKANADTHTYDQYGCEYFGVAEGSDWKAEVEKWAKEELLSQMIKYYIMNKEGLRPNAEQYATLLDGVLVEDLAKNNVTADRCNTTEEFEAQKEQYRAKMVSTYGERYFEERIYNAIVYEAIISYANTVEVLG
jgi:trigger factor